jgi:hypothetical protein
MDLEQRRREREERKKKRENERSGSVASEEPTSPRGAPEITKSSSTFSCNKNNIRPGELIAEYGDDPEFMALQKKIKEREERERKEKYAFTNSGTK